MVGSCLGVLGHHRDGHHAPRADLHSARHTEQQILNVCFPKFSFDSNLDYNRIDTKKAKVKLEPCPGLEVTQQAKYNGNCITVTGREERF